MKLFISALTLCILVLTSCKRDNDQQQTRFCWQLVDNVGNDMVVICDKTETELVDCIHNNTCGTFSGAGALTNCNYFKVGSTKYCWKIGTFYVRDFSETKAEWLSRCYAGGATPVKIDCFYTCKNWYNRTKRTYKPANTTTYSPVRSESYCADTLATIYQGRQIVLKNDSDSLVVVQFSANGVDW